MQCDMLCRWGESSPSTKFPHYPMHNWDILALNIVDYNLTNLRFFHPIAVPLLYKLALKFPNIPRKVERLEERSCVLARTKNNKSPRWNAGSILPDNTTTIGDGESEITLRPFHIMNAVERMRAKLRTWARAARGLCNADNMAGSLSGEIRVGDLSN